MRVPSREALVQILFKNDLVRVSQRSDGGGNVALAVVTDCEVGQEASATMRMAANAYDVLSLRGSCST